MIFAAMAAMAALAKPRLTELQSGQITMFCYLIDIATAYNNSACTKGRLQKEII